MEGPLDGTFFDMSESETKELIIKNETRLGIMRNCSMWSFSPVQ